MFEFALSLPFLSIIIALSLQLTAALNQYSIVANTVHQGVHYASASAKLLSDAAVRNVGNSSGPLDSVNLNPDCPTSWPNAISGNGDLLYHRQIQERVRSILALSRATVKLESVCLETGARPGIAPAAPRNVYVRVSLKLSGIFGTFGRVSQIVVEEEAPMLQS